jgi:hypothetical protein
MSQHVTVRGVASPEKVRTPKEGASGMSKNRVRRWSVMIVVAVVSVLMLTAPMAQVQHSISDGYEAKLSFPPSSSERDLFLRAASPSVPCLAYPPPASRPC